MIGKIHHYTSDTNARRMVHVYLAVIGVLLAYVLSILPINIPWWFDAPASIGFYGLLYHWFRCHLWKCKIIRNLVGIKTPNWEGVYKGQLKSSHDKFNGEVPIEIDITQTWNTISVRLQTETSQSSSISASFAIAQTTTANLVYEYINHPLADATDTMNIHHGMTSMYMKDKELHGEFFNGRGRNTFGKFSAKKVMNEK